MKHQNPTSPSRTATAPYNFVPLPETIVPAPELPRHDRFSDDRHSGYFEVTLTTASPVYVRCPFTTDQFRQQARGDDKNAGFRDQVRNSPDFFYTSDARVPVIPGSTLRGMLRGFLEIVSYAKVQWLTSKRLFFRSVDMSTLAQYYNSRMKIEGRREGPGVRVLGGIFREHCLEKCAVASVLENDVTQALGAGPAGLYSGNKAKPEYQGRKVWVDRAPDHPFGAFGKFSFQEFEGGREGRLVLTGRMQNKKHAYLFIPADGPKQFVDIPNDFTDPDINNRLLDLFHDRDQITQWQRDAYNANSSRPGYLQDGDPVFYLADSRGRLEFFGRAQMFRLPYKNRPLDLIPEELRDSSVTDFPEALFGYVRSSAAGAAYAGRVFVTDAAMSACDNPFLSPEPIVPHVLGSPKPTAFQFYLTQQEPDNARRLDHYDSPPPHETTIRGTKRYWPQTAEWTSVDAAVERLKESPLPHHNDKQHTRFNPVRAGVEFKFRVYFHNLTDDELGSLCWTLHPAGDEGKTYFHSLGMGKPFGMGSVRLNATLFRVDRRARYSSLFSEGNPSWSTGLDKGMSLLERSNLERLIQPFEKTVLGILGTTTHRLADQARIQMLLVMMVPRDGFHYEDWRNTQRRVLPDPLCAAGIVAAAAAATPSTNSVRAAIPAPAVKPAKPPQPAAPVTSASKEIVVLLTAPSPDQKARVRTIDNIEIPCERVPQYGVKIGDRCRAKVTRNGDQPLKATFDRKV